MTCGMRADPVEQKDANGSSSTSSSSFVAEKDGKLVIPVPGPCK
jgi:hypothetical protein